MQLEKPSATVETPRVLVQLLIGLNNFRESRSVLISSVKLVNNSRALGAKFDPLPVIRRLLAFLSRSNLMLPGTLEICQRMTRPSFRLLRLVLLSKHSRCIKKFRINH